jgi:ATP-dependent Lon protease
MVSKENEKMSVKNRIISVPHSPKSPNSPKVSTYDFLINKTIFFKRVIQDTIIAMQRFKVLGAVEQSDFHVVTSTLEKLFDEVNKIQVPSNLNNELVSSSLLNKCQKINDELAATFKSYGTQNMDDIINICLSNDYIVKHLSGNLSFKYELIRRYVRPLSYRVISWKGQQRSDKPRALKKNRIVEDASIIENASTLECFDLARTSKLFPVKVYGLRVVFHDSHNSRTMIVNGLAEDAAPFCRDNAYIEGLMMSLENTPPTMTDFDISAYERFLKVLTLKELLVYSYSELNERFAGYMNQVKLVKQKSIPQVVREFIASDLYMQRTILIQLLLKSDLPEYQYLSYLLYDLLSNDSNNSVDSRDQVLLFDSFPWCIRSYFKAAMQQTVKYTETLANFDTSRIPLEQQICLMKASDNVKEKAMLKLKEVKAKSEDSGSKARQFLEGLLRIPFGSYKQEPILTILKETQVSFQELALELKKTSIKVPFDLDKQFTSIEMRKYIQTIQSQVSLKLGSNLASILIDHLTTGKRAQLVSNVSDINAIIRHRRIKRHKLIHSGKNQSYIKTQIQEFIGSIINDKVTVKQLLRLTGNQSTTAVSDVAGRLPEMVEQIEVGINEVSNYLSNVTETLDNAVHGHNKAKRQVERIIGQWINGKSTGYCFGFEGPPGVGKTSLAKKGIARCLVDRDNISRPFSFVPIGGSSNGSTLEGHNYTYVGSTWGRIVDILMETKCMNPIIFIDELDKVSNTEHGREIIGILTHLIDPAQNTGFNDKYFSGIDIDLSKALFIFSYNDPSKIDRILLDRIHRVHFEHLTLKDKLVIVRSYLLPEILINMGLEEMITVSDETIETLIQEYTCEPGVRKLKELLFEIVGEMNLRFLKGNNSDEIPIELTYHDIQHNYLKDKTPVRIKTRHSQPMCGVMNGLWANGVGQGGIIPIEVSFYPCGSFLELSLTGMQGDVMKESMNVSKTVAWSLLTEKQMTNLNKSFTKTKNQGIHIHCPEGSVPKDGPSAGGAITVAIYSRLVNRPIRHDIAMTGEIDLKGSITAIGGLDLKILGGIRAGIIKFLYPTENHKEFNDFMEKYQNDPLLEGIEFMAISHISEVVQQVIVME